MKKLVSAVLAIVLMFALFAPVTASQSRFSDVRSGSWYYGAVNHIAAEGIMRGVTDTTFAPHDTMSRAMVATILYRLAGEPSVAFAPTFTDVPDGTWFSSAVVWANNNQIVQGIGGSRFAPHADVTREQLATLLFRFAEFSGIDTTVPAGFDLTQFTDREQVGSWAQTSMTWAVYCGLITGTSAITLTPVGTATRAQCAMILYRFLGLQPTPPEQSTTPTVANTTVAKTSVTQGVVAFTLTNSPTLVGTWNIYRAATGPATPTGISVSVEGATLSISHATDVPAGTYFITVTEADRLESARVALTVGPYVYVPTPPEQSTTPTVANTTVAKTSATQAVVAFTLTNSPALIGTWNVYRAATGPATPAGISVSVEGATLSISHATDVPAGTYFITVTEADRLESVRVALTVGPYVPIGPPELITVTFAPGANGTLAGGTPNVTLQVLPGTVLTAADVPGVTPATGFNFTSWAPSNPAGHTVTAPITFTAQYAPVPPITVTFAPGANGTLAGGTPNVTLQVLPGTVLTAADVPGVTPATGFSFTGWAPSNPVGHTVTAPITFTAQYAPIPLITVTFAPGANGTLAGGTPNVTIQVLPGTVLTAANVPGVTPATGFNFTGWAPSNPVGHTVTAPITFTAQYAPIISTTPTVANGTVVKTAATQAVVTFTLTNSPALTGTWNIYSLADGPTTPPGISVSVTGSTLSISHATDVPAGTYFITLTQTNHAESIRVPLTVEAFTPAGQSRAPVFLETTVAGMRLEVPFTLRNLLPFSASSTWEVEPVAFSPYREPAIEVSGSTVVLSVNDGTVNSGTYRIRVTEPGLTPSVWVHVNVD